MKVSAYYPIHYGKEYLEASIKSIRDHVDEILILYTPIDELILRVKNRSHVEIGDNLKYNRKYFVKLLIGLK